MSITHPGQEPCWDTAAISTIYAAKTPLSASEVSSVVAMALEVMSRDPEASVDPVPERLRNKRCLMDWSEVRDVNCQTFGSRAMYLTHAVYTGTALLVL